MSDPVVVVGAGLSGLRASHLLARAGVEVLLLEARQRIGGRVLSAGLPGDRHRVDLGPSWFWPGVHPRLQRLIGELGLRSFAQHTQGDAAHEASDGTVHRQRAWAHAPSASRVEGGMQALTEGLQAALAGRVQIRAGASLQSLALRADAIEMGFNGPQGACIQRASHVILAMPPRLVAQDVRMTPEWPEPWLDGLRQTPTWMAGHAKFAAIYASPFWREAGWSGLATSRRGPLAEIHDASDDHGRIGALFGFVGAPPSYRIGIGQEALAQQAVAQLVRLFGDQASKPLWHRVQDWATDTTTASQADWQPLMEHPHYGVVSPPPDWRQRLLLASTECSRDHGGYLEGSLDAAEAAVDSLLTHRRHQFPAATDSTQQGSAS